MEVIKNFILNAVRSYWFDCPEYYVRLTQSGNLVFGTWRKAPEKIVEALCLEENVNEDDDCGDQFWYKLNFKSV